MVANPVDDLRRIVDKALNACSMPLPDAAGDRSVLLALSFDEIRFDSLNLMEFCIAVAMEVGVELGVGEVAALKTPNAVSAHLSQRA